MRLEHKLEDALNRFSEILKTTEYNFHDGSLETIEFNLNTQTLLIRIEHGRYDKQENHELIILSTFSFTVISSIELKYEMYSLKDIQELDIISSVSAKQFEQNLLFSITGVKGWKLDFVAGDFIYDEKKITEF